MNRLCRILSGIFLAASVTVSGFLIWDSISLSYINELREFATESSNGSAEIYLDEDMIRGLTSLENRGYFSQKMGILTWEPAGIPVLLLGGIFLAFVGRKQR